MEALISLVYKSTQTKAPTPTALHLLVQRARIRNVGLGVTGALLYDGFRFMQCLEGPESGVDRVYASISGDDRHKDIALLYRQGASRRDFGKWSMGFVSLFGDDRLGDLQALALDAQYPPGTPRYLLSSFLRAKATWQRQGT